MLSSWLQSQVLMVAKYQTTAPWGGDEGLMLLPVLGGFVTNYMAALVQALLRGKYSHS